MTDKEYVLTIMQSYGKAAAADLQGRAATMTGTEINAEDHLIPSFVEAVARMNMLERKAGFVCLSPAGRVVKLLQVYDSTVYTQDPEELPAQWGFVWSQDPAKARPFIALATSPYATGDCCTHAGHVWRSGQDGNVWEPGTTGVKWDDLGEIDA